MRLASLGAGVALYATARPPAVFANTASTLLLTCMDYRLTGHLGRYMASRNLAGDYDHVVLAGAALGALTEKYPAWSVTFWDHVAVAVQLHKITRVMVIDHRDCGAYTLLLSPEHGRDPAIERDVHARQLHALRHAIKVKHPTLDVELLLMALDGSVEAIA